MKTKMLWVKEFDSAGNIIREFPSEIPEYLLKKAWKTPIRGFYETKFEKSTYLAREMEGGYNE